MAKTPVPDMRKVLTTDREELLETLWSKTCRLRDENSRLASLRDALFPALLSGRIHTTEIEDTVEEAAS